MFSRKKQFFYERHHAHITEAALETGSVRREVPLMVTKHCVRYALGLCLKDNIEKVKENPTLKEKFRPDPLILKSGPNTSPWEHLTVKSAR